MLQMHFLSSFPWPIGLALLLVIYLLVAIGYIRLTSVAYRRSGRWLLALTWLVCSLVYGYFTYVDTCSWPLTCDLLGFPYWRHLVPRYSAEGAISLGASTVLLFIVTRRRATLEPTRSETYACAGASVLVLLLVKLTLWRAWPPPHWLGAALPNTRLKLSAPVLKESGGRPEGRCCRILFVNIPAWRRSLSAIR
jgi:hypothetical protein